MILIEWFEGEEVEGEKEIEVLGCWCKSNLKEASWGGEAACYVEKEFIGASHERYYAPG